MNVFADESILAREKCALKSALDLIGNTALFDLSKGKAGAGVYAKAEFQNPSGSIKDRMVAHVIEQAELRGELKPGQTVVEATSGNTGVSLAMVAAIKGYNAIIIAPDSTSDTKRHMMELYGAKILLTDNRKGINATVEKAYKIAEEQDAYLLNQFQNPDNPKAHRKTGRELLSILNVVDVFVAGVGTGGTLVGVGETLKETNPDTHLVAIEPSAAPALYNLFHGKELPIGSGIPHSIEGIGETFVPEILVDNLDLIDDVVLVNDRDAFSTVRELGRVYGYCVGISSGANVYVARKIAEKFNHDKNIVTILPDSGQRYLRVRAREVLKM